jgi:hypothetical protein
MVIITIPSMPEGKPPVSHRIHMVWRRFPTQDMYYPVELIPGNPLPPVLAWCYCGLNEAPPIYSALNSGFNINENNATTPLERLKSITFPKEMLRSFEPRNLISEPRVMKPCGPIQELEIYDERGLSVTLFAQPVIMELQQPVFEITNRELLKVTWLEPDPNDPNTWDYFKVPVEPNEGIYGIWGDSNDPCGFQGVVNYTLPYIYRIEAQSAVPIESNSLTVTMELQALDDNNDVLNKMPCKVDLCEKSPDGLQIAGEVAWAATMVESLQGVHPVDSNGTLVVFYMPEDTHPRISWQRPEDYNSDDEVNVEDLSMFAEHWLPGDTFSGKIGPQNLIPLCDNWLLDDPNNDLFPDDIINFRDISVLAGMWDDDVFVGTDNYNLSYEVPNPNLWDGQINFQDFAAFAESWLK